MATFTDTFTGASPDLTWTNIRGSATPTSNGDDTVSLPGETWQFALASDADTEAPGAMYAETLVAANSTTAAQFTLLLLGFNEAGNNGYAVVLGYDAGWWCAVLRYSGNIASGSNILGGDVPVDLPSTPFTLGAEVEDGVVQVLVNGSPLLAAADDEPIVATDPSPYTGGAYGGIGVREGGTTVRFGWFEVGHLDDPGPGPGPGGAPGVIDTHTDVRTSGGAGTLAVAVPGVAEGHGLLAVITSIYNGDDLEPSSSDSAAWDQIGGQLGDSGGEANQRCAAFVAIPEGASSTRTVTVDVTNEASLTVLHLDAVPTVEDFADHLVPRNDDPDAEQTVGPVDVPADGGLVVGIWSGVQFDGAIEWTPDEPGATIRAQQNMGGDGRTGYLVTTEEVETGPVSRTATATGAPAPSAGYAGKLIVLSGEGGDPGPGPDDDEAAVRYGWGAPLPASDEFDTPGLPDPTRWSVYGYNYADDEHGTWGNPHGNGLRNSLNATVITEAGETFLRLRGDANGDQGALASRFDQQYGRWEIRARFDRDAGSGTRPMNALGIIWPESEIWPEDGEYDFLETPSGASAAQAWIHYPHQVWPPDNAQEQAIHPGGIDLTEFHNYAVEWDETGVRCWIDGEFWYEFDGQGDGAVPDSWPGEPEDFRVADIQDMPSGHLTLQYDNFAEGTGGDLPQAGTYDIEWARIYPPADRQTGPGAYAGGNLVEHNTLTVGDTVTLTGTAGPGATGHAWSVISGPDQYGDTLGTTQAVEFTPTLPGLYLLQYTATGGGTSTDRVKVLVRPAPESTTRVNLALNPQFGHDPGGGGNPYMWWGGDQVPVTGVEGVTTGLYADEGDMSTGRFPVADSNWHDAADRVSVAIVVVPDEATTITCGVDFYTELTGGTVIPVGARVSNATEVECPAGVPTRIVILDQPRDPESGNPDYSDPQPLIVPSNAVSGLVTAVSSGGVPFVATALIAERGPTVGPYFDGTTADAQWTGAAHQSTSTTDAAPSVALDRAGEVSAARPIVAGKAVTVIATGEAAASRPLSVGKTTTVIGTGATNQARPLATAKATTLGRAGEQSATRPVEAGRSTVLGRAGSVAAPRPFGAATKGSALTPPATTGTPRPLQRVKVTAAGRTGEAHAARPLTSHTARSIARTGETGAARPLTVVIGDGIATAGETSGARPFTPPAKVTALGRVGDLATAAALTTSKAAALARASTTAGTRALVASAALASIGELARARALPSPDKASTLGRGATEAAARPLDVAKSLVLGRVGTDSAARALVPGTPLVSAAETSGGRALTSSKATVLGRVGSSGGARSLLPVAPYVAEWPLSASSTRVVTVATGTVSVR